VSNNKANDSDVLEAVTTEGNADTETPMELDIVGVLELSLPVPHLEAEVELGSIPSSSNRLSTDPPLFPELEEEPKPVLRLLTQEEIEAELLDIKARMKVLDEGLEDDSTLSKLNHLQHQLNIQFMPQIQHTALTLRATQKEPEKLGAVLLARVMAMEATLNLFLDPEFKLGWQKSLVFAARAQGFKGKKCARSICMWIHRYLDSNCRLLPLPAYRGNRESLLADKDFASDLQLYLLEKSKEIYIKGQTIVKYVASQSVQERYGAVKICEKTGTRWLQRMKWRYGKALRGMYIDGHERADVVAYRGTFINWWTTQYLP
jgi:hypothetical protein